jgi:hypothetical protein
MARPTKLTPQIAETICVELADGKSLRSVCDKNKEVEEQKQLQERHQKAVERMKAQLNVNR